MILLFSKVILVKLMVDRLAKNFHIFNGNKEGVKYILSHLYELRTVSAITSSRNFLPIIIHSICHACYMSCTSHRTFRDTSVPGTTTAVLPASRSNYWCRHPSWIQDFPTVSPTVQTASCTNKLTDRHVFVRYVSERTNCGTRNQLQYGDLTRTILRLYYTISTDISSYRTVNTLRLCYTNQPVKVV